MTKKTAHIVNQQRLKNMVIANNENKDLDVTGASKHLSGKDHTISENVNNDGFSYGLRRAIQSDDFVNFLATVSLNSKTSRTIGLSKNQSKFTIIKNMNI